MDHLLALTLPGAKTAITPPKGVPTGGLEKVAQILGVAVTYFLIAAIIITLFSIIWGGLQWTSSGGDKTKLEAARKRITWAIIGLIICLLSFFMVNGIGYFFGLNLLDISK